MAGTRTAPTVDYSAPTKVQNTLHLIDASGDLWTDVIETPAQPLATDVEAWAAGYQAVTQSSLWQVSQQLTFAGDADPQNAEALFRAGGQNGINLLMKNLTTRDTQTDRVISPVADIMQGNQDIPLLTGGAMPAYIASALALLLGYQLTSAQFTSQRERRNNPRVRV